MKLKSNEWETRVPPHQLEAELTRLRRSGAKIIKTIRRTGVRGHRRNGMHRTTGSVTIVYRKPAMQMTCRGG